MISQAGDLARRLARDAEAACRHYLSNGQRCGRYWVAGDVMNTPGRSLYVRLQGPESGPGAAGKWIDAATAEEAYLRARGITGRLDWPALRYHPSVYHRAAEDAPLEVWPALLAAVTDLDGDIARRPRPLLDPLAPAKAPLADPRRALGALLGSGVHFGKATDTLAAGEGVETMLALKAALPLLPMVAGLSANHLAALKLPPALRRLYVAHDNDAAGLKAAHRMHERGTRAGIDVRDLVPVHADFNLDPCRLGPAAMVAHLAAQLAAFDLERFLPCALGQRA